jgi:hypothetical protein
MGVCGICLYIHFYFADIQQNVKKDDVTVANTKFMHILSQSPQHAQNDVRRNPCWNVLQQGFLISISV